MRAKSDWHGRVGAVDVPALWQVTVDAPAGAGEVQVREAIAAAQAIVWLATCQRYPGAVSVAARWTGTGLCRSLDLREAFAYPVISMEAVRQIEVGGTVRTWAAEEWRFDRPWGLVKQYSDTDGAACFPCQDVYRPVSYQGSWWLEAWIGAHPPGDVRRATGLLAREILLAEVDPERCSLPDNVRSVTRQGTTIEFDRSEWSGVPLMKELTAPFPKGHGCSPQDYEFGRDPARHQHWVDVPLASLPEQGS